LFDTHEASVQQLMDLQQLPRMLLCKPEPLAKAALCQQGAPATFADDIKQGTPVVILGKYTAAAATTAAAALFASAASGPAQDGSGGMWDRLRPNNATPGTAAAGTRSPDAQQRCKHLPLSSTF
jgi:hypothetical protein